MISKKWMFIMGVFIFVLSACLSQKSLRSDLEDSSKLDENEQPEVQDDQQLGESKEYPAPTELAPEVEPYPALDSIPTEALITLLYPDLDDGMEIQWVQAYGLIMNGEVVKIVQTKDLKVSVTLRDGRTLFMIQPEMDAIVKIVDDCGDLCSDILIESQ